MVQSTVVRHWIKGFLYSTSLKLCCCWSGTHLSSAAAAQALSSVWRLLTLWTVACQVPLSMGFFRQDYWSRLPFPPPKHLSNLQIKPESPALQVDSLLLNHWGSPHANQIFPLINSRPLLLFPMNPLPPVHSFKVSDKDSSHCFVLLFWLGTGQYSPCCCYCC